jgi:hypothetical protein
MSMQSWTEPGDLDRQVKVDELLARAARAAGRWLRWEMGIEVRWGFCFQVAFVLFLALFLLWLGEALPQLAAPVR